MNELFHGCLFVCSRGNAYVETWDNPRIQPRRTADFIGSSTEREIGFSRKALGQPAQPGNSYRQNSWHVASGVPSADILPSRHLTGSISNWGMMLPLVRRERDTLSHR
jgi:hypothetical protein